MHWAAGQQKWIGRKSPQFTMPFSWTGTKALVNISFQRLNVSLFYFGLSFFWLTNSLLKRKVISKYRCSSRPELFSHYPRFPVPGKKVGTYFSFSRFHRFWSSWFWHKVCWQTLSSFTCLLWTSAPRLQLDREATLLSTCYPPALWSHSQRGCMRCKRTDDGERSPNLAKIMLFLKDRWISGIRVIYVLVTSHMRLAIGGRQSPLVPYQMFLCGASGSPSIMGNSHSCKLSNHFLGSVCLLCLWQ